MNFEGKCMVNYKIRLSEVNQTQKEECLESAHWRLQATNFQM